MVTARHKLVLKLTVDFNTTTKYEKNDNGLSNVLDMFGHRSILIFSLNTRPFSTKYVRKMQVMCTIDF